MPNSKQIVYLSQAQYEELITNQSITVNGVTVTYNENDIYVTPQAEPVTDVRVAGTSVAANGVANIPLSTNNAFGVVKGREDRGITIGAGVAEIRTATDATISASNSAYLPITPINQHKSTFYGLAKASGDTTQSSSSNAVGSYTPEAKGAIQQMLGVSDLIGTSENDLVASKAYKVGEVFTANGKLYKATAAIAADAAIIPAVEGETVAGANCEETSVGDGFPHDVQVNGESVVSDGVANLPIVDNEVNGVGKTVGMVRFKDGYCYGFKTFLNGNDYCLAVRAASENGIKTGKVQNTNGYGVIDSTNINAATFYGLAKAAGDTTQAASDNAVGTYTDEAKAAIRTMLGAVGDVQVDGTSVVTDGVAEISLATSTNAGVVKCGTGLSMMTGANAGKINTNPASTSACKNGAEYYAPITPNHQHEATFYGLAKAAGDTTQSASSNAVGVYTNNAKASIKSMLGIVDGSTGTVNITGATPTINAVENTRYVCGEVTSLSFTPPSSGISIVRFTSGSTVTVLTIPSTVKFPEWFDPTALETNTIYEICVTDGTFGAVMSWAL